MMSSSNGRRTAAGAWVLAVFAVFATSTGGTAHSAGATIDSIRGPGASATELAVRVAAPPPVSGHFQTLPPGASLPSDEACAAAVRSAAEIRPTNAVQNHTTGVGETEGHPRVTGNFTGTTDELIQWAACKWGIDEDIARAQIAKESWWHQDAGGDLTWNPELCHPLLRTTMPCPESTGLGQVRYQYHAVAFVNDNAIRSSASNLDYTYSIWRSCFEGELEWLNTVERGAQYAAGDVWGCIGVWFSGRWYVPRATEYITAVQQYTADRIWESPEFVSG